MSKRKSAKKIKVSHAKKPVVRASRKVRARVTPVLNSGDLPATQGMLILFEKKIKSEFRSMGKSSDSKFNKVDARFSEMEARFDKVDARFSEMEARFDKVDARFSEMETRFDKVDANIANVLTEVHRLALVVEEQNARNKFVLDGYEQLYRRQDRLEKEVDRRLAHVEDIVSRKPTQV